MSRSLTNDPRALASGKVPAKGGRRPAPSTTSESIRAHAGRAFAESGYRGVSVREIARRAGVDSALVFHYFKTKRALFEASLGVSDLAFVLPILATPMRATASATLPSVGERMIIEFLQTWDPPRARATLVGLLRSAGSVGDARESLNELIARTIVTPAIGGIDARRGMPKVRAALVAAQLVGIACSRYVLASEPIATASARMIARTFGPSIDVTLAGIDYGRGPRTHDSIA